MIRKLPQIVIQQIAAGEVVERPASVLKELVENSIDADANQIKVEHEDGGIRSLRVSDDGVGISETDLPLVFESHATSKLQALEDLDHLATMGFRGEAMSSISAVSRVSIWSGLRGASVANKAVMEFGHWRGVEAADRRIGTEILVEDLFARLPVRAKFLKTPAAEARQLLQLFKKIALSYPEREFIFCERGKAPKLHWVKQKLFDRALEYFESTEPQQWFEGESSKHSKNWSVKFVFLKPRYFQAARQNLQIYLNRRVIRDRKLEFAVRRAFEGYSETPQFSCGAIFLEGNPELFDVNVHPTKMEIRFKDADEVFSAIVHSVRDRLESLHQNEIVETKAWIPSKISDDVSPRATVVSRSPLAFPSQPESASMNLVGIESRMIPAAILPQQKLFEVEWELLGGVDHTFWVVKRGENLFLFDQHALHERILYEELRAQFEAAGQLTSQRMLFPIDITFEERESLEDHREFLESLGFDWTIDSKGRWKLIATPSLLKKNAVELLREALKGVSKSKETLLRDLLSTMACHSAIRAGDPVPSSTALSLLSKFQSDDALGHCPHGRPTFVRMGIRDLEKLFHRA